jgi:hypothetical protein
MRYRRGMMMLLALGLLAIVTSGMTLLVHQIAGRQRAFTQEQKRLIVSQLRASAYRIIEAELDSGSPTVGQSRSVALPDALSSQGMIIRYKVVGGDLNNLKVEIELGDQASAGRHQIRCVRRDGRWHAAQLLD